MLRAKVNRTDKLLLVNSVTGKEVEQQRVTRYYVSKSDNYLLKQMPPLGRKVTKIMQQTWKKHDYCPTPAQLSLIEKCLKNKETPDPDLIGNPPQEVLSEMKPRIRYNHIQEGRTVSVANEMPDKLDQIDYSFYIAETEKLVNIFK
jgi:hypothetical protein